ncbi:MarR family winged helix-turn-helix transcriptional regulator [Guptibacillus hwajinpoensis]|uniref:MarR family winged helix-turn-helix transcriptional regulator n=1 Tax=Guptibacillus hwajinpoensis TaxID=208199 RepID=UPI001CFDE8AD|nr:MarR family transcriptional regulator [Pseudalkalibacillus hwajinpoensis]WLR60805.1 MarR family transcriptional regulator [Pseudalkalibacillus hwajinpoensis]
MKNSCSNEGEILYQLNDIYKQMSPKFERCTGISQSRLELLHKLFEVDEISQTALQKEVNIDSAAVTRHLKQLEVKKMVTRRKNPDDNRFTFVRLTEEGRDRIASFRKEKEQFIQKVLKDFTEQEQSELSNMLNRIQNNIKEIQY